ncbi:hypothetical protein C2845_PM11G08860 [Panicum miliaceum]|uniref:KIB1-4 beta-propeller domain-containing protein n=1 Tax=Panicum miliaceum TaxID=4540 RepID=A0A3L6RR03_PANMI|nr:hypothetical protein C2845_PM11G08860 [Panicum miliaceum]
MAPRRRKKSASSSSPWPSLPPDIAGQVLLRLPSYADRICFSAACRSWRASAARHRSPPRLPCLVFGDGTFRGFPEGDRPFRLPAAAGFLGSCGEWLVFKHGSAGGGGYSLANPFSKAAGAVAPPLPSPSCVRARQEPVFQAVPERAIPEYDQIGLCADEPEPRALSVRKLLVCPASVVASVIGGEEYGRLGKLAVCQPGAPAWSVSVHDQWRRIKDMAAHRGTLYALDHNEDLLAVSVVGGEDGDGGPAVSGITRVVTGAPPSFSGRRRLTLHYLVDAGAALLMVRREVCRGRPEQGRGIEERFTVFEANFGAARWEELRALGDGMALLVGRWCSAAVRVPEERRRQWGGFIYFLEDDIVDQENREYSLSAYDYNS